MAGGLVVAFGFQTLDTLVLLVDVTGECDQDVRQPVHTQVHVLKALAHLGAHLLKQADRHISEGLHPRVITDGYEIAKNEALKVCFLHEHSHCMDVN